MRSHTGKKLPMLGYASGTDVATTLKAVQRQCDFISVWEMHFAWFHNREEITKARSKPPPLCWRYAWVDLKLRFHIFHKWIIINHICMEGHTKQLLGNARISSILIVAKESHESSTLSVYPCSQCIDIGRSTSCFIVNPNEKSQRNEICVLPCRPQLRTNIKSHIGEKPNKCN